MKCNNCSEHLEDILTDDGPTCSRCDCSVSVRSGEEWEQGVDVCDHCAQAHTSNEELSGAVSASAPMDCSAPSCSHEWVLGGHPLGGDACFKCGISQRQNAEYEHRRGTSRSAPCSCSGCIFFRDGHWCSNRKEEHAPDWHCADHCPILTERGRKTDKRGLRSNCEVMWCPNCGTIVKKIIYFDPVPETKNIVQIPKMTNSEWK